MDIKQIQELIKLVSKSGIGELKITEGDFQITIKASTGNNRAITHTVASQVDPHAIEVSPEPPAQTVQPAKEATRPPQKDVTPPASENLIVIKSPMVGTFYRRPSPDKEPFVNVGDVIKPGDVLCVIEAMKLFNEIESEYSGKLVKILVDDSAPVEYDQPIFMIEPL